VLQKLASPTLLDTYNTERQPVGAQLVTLSNIALRKHIAVWHALGCAPLGSSQEQRLAGIAELKSKTKEGKERRKILKERLDDMHHETHALGIERNQLYTGAGIYTVDEPESFRPQGKEAEDSDMYHEPSTYPGRRLPHVWLGTLVPGPLVSTLDVAGKGRFALFTGIGGEAWKQAAGIVSNETRVELTVVGIGRGLEWEDVYLDWEVKRETEEDGCVLVRPDYFVAWRSMKGGDEVGKLRKALRAVLGLRG
jgi:hypothetical protein